MIHTLTAGHAMTAMTLTKNPDHNYAKLCATARAKYKRKKLPSKYESHFQKTYTHVNRGFETLELSGRLVYV
jgi:hypothetical protein